MPKYTVLSGNASPCDKLIKNMEINNGSAETATVEIPY